MLTNTWADGKVPKEKENLLVQETESQLLNECPWVTYLREYRVYWPSGQTQLSKVHPYLNMMEPGQMISEVLSYTMGFVNLCYTLNFSRSLPEGEKKFCLSEKERWCLDWEVGKDHRDRRQTAQERKEPYNFTRGVSSLLLSLRIFQLFRKSLTRVHRRWRLNNYGTTGLFDNLEHRQIVEDADHCSNHFRRL